jgi:rhodanese-related sulfurtransferase
MESYAENVDYTPQQVFELARNGDLQLIDVRTAAEVEAGRIDGGRHIELLELQGQAETIDRDRPVIFYCRSGGRSAMATAAFAGAGFDAHNMSGGLLEWVARGLPIDPADGYVADH